MTLYVSGAEPAPIREALAPCLVSNLPEDYGADFLFFSDRFGACGIQRKTFPEDLLNSRNDGRLAKELNQMRDLDTALIVLEGTPWFTDTGNLLYDYGSFTAEGVVNLTLSFFVNYGIYTHWTENHAQTVQFVKWAYNYLCNSDTSALASRPAGKAVGQKWGSLAESPEFAQWVLASVPGLGTTKARSIVEHFGGRVPLRLDASIQELTAVPGIGKVGARRIKRALDVDYQDRA